MSFAMQLEWGLGAAVQVVPARAKPVAAARCQRLGSKFSLVKAIANLISPFILRNISTLHFRSSETERRNYRAQSIKRHWERLHACGAAGRHRNNSVVDRNTSTCETGPGSRKSGKVRGKHAVGLAGATPASRIVYASPSFAPDRRALSFFLELFQHEPPSRQHQLVARQSTARPRRGQRRSR